MAAAASLMFPARAAEEDGLVAAAILYALPWFEVARSGWVSAGPTPDRPQHRYNRMVHRRLPLDPTARNVTTPNNDTLYSTARINLSAGPVDVLIPDAPSRRYFSVAFMNGRGDNLAYVGTRSTAGLGGRVRVARWDQTVLAGGDHVIRSDTMDVWVLARWLCEGEDDLPAVHALQDATVVQPPDGIALLEPSVRPVSAEDGENLLAVTCEALARAAPRFTAEVQARRFSEIGLRPGVPITQIHPGDVDRWRQEAPRTLRTLSEDRAPDPIIGGWRAMPSKIGSPLADDFTRARVALTGLGALESVETRYWTAETDDQGKPLSGDRRYQLRFQHDGLPDAAFWSLSMYEQTNDGRMFFVGNPIARHSIGDRTVGLHRESDGGLTLSLQTEQPSEGISNWLPTPPGPWRAVLRTYLPGPLMTSWLPPGFTAAVA